MLQSHKLQTLLQAPLAAPCLKRSQGSRRPFSSCPTATAACTHRTWQPNRRQFLAASTFANIRSKSRATVTVMAAQPSSQDLLIVGPGVLGSYLGVLWKQEFPQSTVTAQTNTDSNHDRLRKMGLVPVTADAAPAGKKFPYVLFAAPPSGSADYPAAVQAATQQWDGSGSFVFTSSMSVCATQDGSTVNEDCPLVSQGTAPGTDKLLGAEDATLAAGGNVLRLVGLYHAGRGPHTFFIKQGEVARYGGYVVNMLHYEDAARLAFAILKGEGCEGQGYRGKIFLGTDNHPLTFQEMVDACFASGLFGSGTVKFTGTPQTGGGLGKKVNNDVTRQLLGGWAPKYNSFKQFFMDGGKDYYNSSGMF